MDNAGPMPFDPALNNSQPAEKCKAVRLSARDSNPHKEKYTMFDFMSMFYGFFSRGGEREEHADSIIWGT